jgi:hypothetical protein
MAVIKVGCLAAAVDSVERDLPVGADRVPGEGTPAAQDRVKKEDNSDQVPEYERFFTVSAVDLLT